MGNNFRNVYTDVYFMYAHDNRTLLLAQATFTNRNIYILDTLSPMCDYE